MDDFLHRLRERPTHERQLISFGAAGGITAVIALVWSVTLLNGTGPFIAPDGQAAAALEGIRAFAPTERVSGENAWKEELEMMRQSYQARLGIDAPTVQDEAYRAPSPDAFQASGGPNTSYAPIASTTDLSAQ
jgi:hypothetical protein